MESMFFIFDGIQSSQMGLYNVRIDHSGFIEVPYWGSTDIKEEVSVKRLAPYFYGVTREPIEFTLQFVLADKNMMPKKWDSQERYKIAKWLVHDTYKSFQISDDLGKYYHVICTNPANLNLINNEGYVELTFRNDSPYAWTGTYIDSFNISDNDLNGTIIQLENKSNVLKYYNPLIEIEFIDTDVQLKNLSNNGRIMSFKDMTPGEIVSIDCQNRIIKSSLFGSNPFANFNKDLNYRYWLDLVYGVNQFLVNGRCKIRTKSCYPIAQ